MTPVTATSLAATAREIAAAAGHWVESKALEALCWELSEAVVGHPRAPRSTSRVLLQPATERGDTFENHVFALRPYCFCDGVIHGLDHDGMVACPANFEYFENGVRVIRGEWFVHLGKGTVFDMAPSPAQVAHIRRACLGSLDR